MGQVRTTPTRLSPFPAPTNVLGQPHSWPQRHTPTSLLGKLPRTRAMAFQPRPPPPHAGTQPHSVPSTDPSPHQRRKKNAVPATYLKEPVAPPVEGGDDGGMDIAAVQALGREEKREFSWKEERKGGRKTAQQRRSKKGPQTRPVPGGDRGQAPLRLAPGPRTRSGSENHSWQT